MATKNRSKPIFLISDNAIEEAKDDKLEFKNYAFVLSRSVLNSKGPLTYGIFGKWGSGKTSLMKLIKQGIDKEQIEVKDKQNRNEKKHLTVWFNPWRYESQEHPIVPLCASIISEIDLLEEDIGQAFEKLKKALKAIAHGFTFKAPGVELSLADILYDKKSENIGQLSIVDLSLKSLDEFSKQITDKKIIVFIDDLDRCSPVNAVKLLESIKLILNQTNFIFIFGLDRGTIESYFEEKYRNYAKISGTDYIEKLLQVSVYIPDYSHLISKYAAFLVKSYINNNAVREFEPLFPAIGKLCRNNPRMVKRFLNSIILAREYAMEKEKRPVSSLISLAFTIALTMQWPEVAKALENNRDGINHVLSQGIYKDGKVNNNELQRLASDEKNVNESIYRKIFQDQSLYNLIFSKQGKVILASRENLFQQNIIKARKIGPYFSKSEEPGELYQEEKKAKIASRGYTYENIIHNEEFSKRVRKLFPEIFDDVLAKSDQAYFKKIKWTYPKGTEGDILGIVSDAEGKEYYLMKFYYNDEEVYQFIGKDGVEVIDN